MFKLWTWRRKYLHISVSAGGHPVHSSESCDKAGDSTVRMKAARRNILWRPRHRQRLRVSRHVAHPNTALKSPITTVNMPAMRFMRLSTEIPRIEMVPGDLDLPGNLESDRLTMENSGRGGVHPCSGSHNEVLSQFGSLATRKKYSHEPLYYNVEEVVNFYLKVS
jgi:hypothetical protein